MRSPVRPKTCAFFTLVLVLAGCVTAGCSYLPFFSSQSKEIPKINVGFTSANFSNGHGSYSFDDVTGRLPVVDLDAGNASRTNATEGRHILYIRGTDMDETGAAGSWMFAVRHANRTSLVTYDRRGETISDGSTGFTGQEIFLDRIVSPAQLLDMNRAVIFKTLPDGSESAELELWGGNYTLTITGRDKTRILLFDAKTGALTLSND